MAQRLETITQHVYAFDTDELDLIVESLYANGHEELAAEIQDEFDSEGTF